MGVGKRIVPLFEKKNITLFVAFAPKM